MKTIALAMMYDEEAFAYKSLQNIYNVVDQIIVSDISVSPFNQPLHSSDNTFKEIQRFIKNEDIKNKIKIFKPHESLGTEKRENLEAICKNKMLKMSDIEDGDIIYMVDIDEFFLPECIEFIKSKFKKNDHMVHTRLYEKQFAYNMSLYFNSSHDGRFLRYRKGAFYTASQHFHHTVDGPDLTKIHTHDIPREEVEFFHLCWVKHPLLLRNKVLTFKRPSFTNWWNFVFLCWPIDDQQAYKNNKTLPPYHGTGFCEGMHEKLRQFEGELPEVLRDYNYDWLSYLRFIFNDEEAWEKLQVYPKDLQ
jgi:hypothetical protein